MKCWLAVDDSDEELAVMYKEKPTRNSENKYWEGESIGALTLSLIGLDMTWESEPVEIDLCLIKQPQN